MSERSETILRSHSAVAVNKHEAGDTSKTERGRETIHPSWRAFMQYCSQLQHGEIERLCIQNGLPVLAEITKKKVKFTS